MKRAPLVPALLIFCSLTAFGQLIPVRTYPVLSEDTYLPLPARYGGMGNVSIALADDQREPFINPAALLSTRARFVSVFVLPRISSWDLRTTSLDVWTSPVDMSAVEDRQSATNYFAPIGVIQHADRTALGLLAAVHRTTSRQFEQWSSGSGTVVSPPTESSFGANNVALSAAGAAFVPGTSIAIGLGTTLVDVRGIDGIQFLYPNSKTLDIDGKLREYRVGLLMSPLSNDQVSLLAGWNSMEVKQSATYEWSPTPVNNEDKNHTWFGQITYRVPLSQHATLGVLGLGNWREHPKLPNYPLSGVPRDPGTTQAYNVGFGFSILASANTLLAFEYVFEPIRCNTWIEALTDLTGSGGVITVLKGERQQENTYTFRDHIARFGAQFEALEWLALQVGAESRIVRYDFVSKNYQWNTEHRASPESRWQEITLTGALRASLGGFEMSYGVALLTGRGLLSATWLRPILWENFRAADVILPPSDWLTVKPVPVFTHQISLRYTFDVSE